MKKVTKSKSAKSTKMAKVQTLREGFKAGSKKNPLPHIKYLNCAVSDISNEKFPEMVQITMGPAKIMDELKGRRYITLQHAKVAIDEMHGFNIVDKGFAKVSEELAELGLLAVANDPGPGHSSAAWENKAY
jgi:hypothetical protein